MATFEGGRLQGPATAAPNFIDLFAGCGGVSLGLINAGWSGFFAIEKNSDAFGTLKANLVPPRSSFFCWPEWLPKRAITTRTLLDEYSAQLEELSGRVDLIAGGPPCQGFSLAGRRIHSDPRNSLTKEYIEIIRVLSPRVILLENVQGYAFPFRKHGRGKARSTAYSALISSELEELGYVVFSELLNLSNFGVPQNRKRFILIAVKRDSDCHRALAGKSPFDMLRESRKYFLQSKGLRISRPITAKEAIGDLETAGKKLIPNRDGKVKGFREIAYQPVATWSRFIRLMRLGTAKPRGGLRLPRHKPRTILQFETIMQSCARGKTINQANRDDLGLKKQALTPLDAHSVAATITTLPDDIIHYSEPRILTVRENARIQTFPDWYSFRGKYTTGGKNRRNECPRYTQVGNAVPPLFAEFVGLVLKRICQSVPS